jgi:hypothetical protein
LRASACIPARGLPGCVREVEDRLRALYDEEDYPSWDRVRGCFDVRWSYFTMNTPQVLPGKLFVREQAKARVQWQEMLEEIRDGLRLTFGAGRRARGQAHAPARRHEEEAGGRGPAPGVLGHLQQEDVADDEQLRALVEEVRGLLNGQDVSRLRKDQGLRELVPWVLELSAAPLRDASGFC